MSRGHRGWILAGAALVTLTGTACAPAALDDEKPGAASTTAEVPNVMGDTGGGSGGDSEGGTELERSRSDASSDIERRISDTFSELGAELRGGDTVITLPDTVLFDFDQHELLTGASGVLDNLAEAITYFAGAPVQVTGHTDGKGTPEYNEGLSERRARSVVDYFVTKGVDADRINAEGLGESQPVATDVNPDGSDDPDGRARNRRVEIVIEGVDPEQLGN
jgi:outer membrane protein OmpA-like peptidoglycan-associated protein